MLAGLGSGLAVLTPTASLTQLAENRADQAYYLALCGIDYARSLGPTGVAALVGAPVVFDTGHGRFTLDVAPAQGGVHALRSTGTVDAGASREANCLAMGSMAGSSHITFVRDLGDFAEPVVSDPSFREPIIGLDLTDGAVTLGNGRADTYGALWYGGDSSAGDCQDGACRFGLGIRAYFVFAVDPDPGAGRETGDGFTFAIINAQTNDTTRSGGDIGMGELLGYAGPGKTVDRRGLRPPKMAVEFDIFSNAGAGNPGEAGSRADGEDGDHVAAVFWGDEESDNTCPFSSWDTFACTYDDNRHSQIRQNGQFKEKVGDDQAGDEPHNAVSKDLTRNPGNLAEYFSRPDHPGWLRSGDHAARIEITRGATPNARGRYSYRIQVWIDCQDCADVLHDYTQGEAHIRRDVELNAARHAAFERMHFGFTLASGEATQRVKLALFEMSFR